VYEFRRRNCCKIHVMLVILDKCQCIVGHSYPDSLECDFGLVK